VTKRLVATVALALVVLGCSPSVQLGEPVEVLTGFPTLLGNGPGCYTNSASGQLIADPQYGTAVIDEIMLRVTGTIPSPVPVMWRPGYSAHRLGSEVAVTDTSGNVVATTGHRYLIAGGYVGGDISTPRQPTGVFWACDTVTPLP
jgi:hypothetical protein